jgi:hypothetical protein
MLRQRRQDLVGVGVDRQAPLLLVQLPMDGQPPSRLLFGLHPFTLADDAVDQAEIVAGHSHNTVAQVAPGDAVADTANASAVGRPVNHFGVDQRLDDGGLGGLIHHPLQNGTVQTNATQLVNISGSGLVDDRTEEPSGIVGTGP